MLTKHILSTTLQSGRHFLNSLQQKKIVSAMPISGAPNVGAIGHVVCGLPDAIFVKDDSKRWQQKICTKSLKQQNIWYTVYWCQHTCRPTSTVCSSLATADLGDNTYPLIYLEEPSRWLNSHVPKAQCNEPTGIAQLAFWTVSVLNLPSQEFSKGVLDVSTTMSTSFTTLGEL